MSTPKPNALPTTTTNSRAVAGPSTPVNSSFPSMATPKSHQTPGGHGTFASPAQRGTPRSMGTPSRSGRTVIGGKTMPGNKTFGAKTATGGVEGSTMSAIAGIGTPAFSFGTPAFNFGSPAITLTSPNALATGTVNIDAFANPNASYSGFDGGVGMGISLSSLGINMSGTAMSTTASAMGKADDAERRRRLENVLQTVSARTGRVSRESLERLGRRCGLDIEAGEVDELAMAGKNVMVDIKFAPHQSQAVDNLAVAFATASDSMTEHAEKAAAILRKDLVPLPGILGINATLDKFADNLGRLAMMDKLGTPGASCFDAVFGVYTSLKRLYEHEKKIADQLFTGSKDRRGAEKEVLCKKSGVPQMHVRDRIGLSLDYWADRHLVPDQDIDATMYGKNDTHTATPQVKASGYDLISRLVIECEATSTTMYPTISITSDWISDRIEKPAEDIEMAKAHDNDATQTNKPVIDWLEPPPLILPPPESSASQAMGDGATTTSSVRPNVRFVARLEPPVAVPLLLAGQIYASVGVDISQDLLVPSTIPSLLFPQHFEAPSATEQVPKSFHIPRTVADRSGTLREYTLGLYPTRIEAAKVLDSMPFIHPKQLVAILPVLRQYTLLTKLLRNTFNSQTLRDEGVGRTGAVPVAKMKDTPPGQSATEVELAALLGGTSSPEFETTTVDISFTATPVPQITVLFTTVQGLKRVTCNILPNAEVEVVEQNISTGSNTGSADQKEDENPGGKRVEMALARALAVCEDLTTWIEWIKYRFLRSE